MIEIWRPIAGYEGYYEISNLARVKSLARIIPYVRNGKTFHRSVEDKILNYCIGHFGYVVVTLCVDKKMKQRKVHKLMATAFLPNPDNKPFINHINGIKTDNSFENLEWVTSSENTIHAFKTGLIKSPKGRKISSVPHNSIMVFNPHTGIYYDSMTDAGRTIGMKGNLLREYMNGRIKINKTPFVYC